MTPEMDVNDLRRFCINIVENDDYDEDDEMTERRKILL